jgi:hypothetical protein
LKLFLRWLSHKTFQWQITSSSTKCKELTAWYRQTSRLLTRHGIQLINQQMRLALFRNSLNPVSTGLMPNIQDFRFHLPLLVKQLLQILPELQSTHLTWVKLSLWVKHRNF